MKKVFLIVLCFLLMTTLAAAGPLVTLEWTPNTEPDLAGYNVYRSQTDGGPYTKIGTVFAPTATYADNTTDYDITYYWVVTAFDNEDPPNESGYSNQVSHLTEQPDVTAPGNPQGVNVSVHVSIQ